MVYDIQSDYVPEQCMTFLLDYVSILPLFTFPSSPAPTSLPLSFPFFIPAVSSPPHPCREAAL